MAEPRILTRDYVLSFFAQFTFSGVLFILVPTIPIYLSRLGAKEAEIGVLVGALSAFSLIFRPIVGKALTRIPERNFMIAAGFLLILSSAACLVALPFWPFLAVRAFQGVCVALFFTASFTLVANISPEARLGQSLGLFYLSINIAFALAPSFGMFIVNLFDFPSNFKVLFWVCTALSVCSFIITLKLKKVQGVPSQDPSLEGQSFLNREVVRPSVMAAMVNVIWGAVTAFFPLYAIQQGFSNPGLFFAVFATMLILGRGFGGKILDLYAKEKEKVILPCMITYIIAMTILAFSSTFRMFMLVAVIWGMGNALLYPMLIMYALDRAGSSRGPAMGTFQAIGDLGTGMGAVIMGIILHWTSYPTMFLCLALTGLLNLLYFQFFVRRKGGSGYANL